MLAGVRDRDASGSQRPRPPGGGRAAASCGEARRRLSGRIGPAAATLFDGRGVERPFQAGARLARRDEAGNEVLVVLHGIVGLYRAGQDPASGAGVLGYCGCGDLIAPAGPGDAWGFDAKAVSDGTLLALSLPEVRGSTSGKADLLWPLFEMACAELVGRTARLRGQWALPVKARLADFLFELEEAVGEPSDKGLILHVPMFRDEIADYLGTRTETICRILTRWREEGLIVMDTPRVLVIPDRARLRADAFA
jgi:CRP/FNR family transcriptional regulator